MNNAQKARLLELRNLLKNKGPTIYGDYIELIGELLSADAGTSAASELNPNHPVSQKLSGQWHKLLIMTMIQMGLQEVIITVADIQNLQNSDGVALSAQELADGLHLRLHTMAEGREIATAAGGTPH